MGWKGTVRSIVAASRAAERESQRRHRQQQKEQMTNESATAVADWENYVDDLVSIHTDMADMIDWRTIATQPRPNEPEEATFHGDRAKAALAGFKPRFFDILKGGSAKLQERLESELKHASKRDKGDYRNQLAAYRQALTEWEDDTSLARQLLKGETAAIKQVIEELQSLTQNELIGSAIEFSIGNNFVHARPKVHGDDIVPSVRRKQLASGRLSETKMPIGQFNELYQDYVASVALKTGGDLFHILPLEELYVTCEAYMLDKHSGHNEWTAILSVQFVRDTFMRLNLANIDPSDSMRNFRHAMSFSKTKGFSSVEPLAPSTA